MGKVTIQTHLGEGKYSVKLQLHRARVEQRLQELTDAISQVNLVELAAAETALTDAQAVLDQAIADQDTAIAGGEREAMTAAARTVAEKAAARDKARVERDRLKLRLTSLKKEKTYLEANMPADPVVEAWCADLTEDLTGEVATMEIPGERNGVPALIRPGYSGQAAHSPARDGQLQPVIASGAAGVFYNWALLPCWQKWKPTHRLATIATLSGDTCTVDLDQALSSAQALPVNQATRLTDVPIQYMDCNGAAFEVGNRVVVEFEGQDWSKPRVIGFESSPKACYIPRFLCLPADDASPEGYGFPFEPPPGTAGGSSPEVLLHYREPDWKTGRQRQYWDLAGMKQEIFDLTNAEREAQGMVPFTYPLTTLADMAQVHADNEAALGIQAHDSELFPEGQQTTAERLGGVAAYGENLARYSHSYNEGAGPTAADVVADWMASSSHRANILGFNHPTLKGVTGCSIGIATDDEYVYFVQTMQSVPKPRDHGNVDWTNGTDIVSIEGSVTRHGTYSNVGSAIYYRGARINGPSGYGLVVGAAMATFEVDGEPVRHFVCVTRYSPYNDYFHVAPAQNYRTGVKWTKIGQTPIGNYTARRHWFFNASGTEGQCLYRLGKTPQIQARAKVTLTATTAAVDTLWEHNLGTVDAKMQSDGTVIAATSCENGPEHSHADFTYSCLLDERELLGVDYAGDTEVKVYARRTLAWSIGGTVGPKAIDTVVQSYTRTFDLIAEKGQEPPQVVTLMEETGSFTLDGDDIPRGSITTEMDLLTATFDDTSYTNQVNNWMPVLPDNSVTHINLRKLMGTKMGAWPPHLLYLDPRHGVAAYYHAAGTYSNANRENMRCDAVFTEHLVILDQWQVIEHPLGSEARENVECHPFGYLGHHYSFVGSVLQIDFYRDGAASTSQTSTLSLSDGTQLSLTEESLLSQVAYEDTYCKDTAGNPVLRVMHENHFTGAFYGTYVAGVTGFSTGNGEFHHKALKGEALYSARIKQHLGEPKDRYFNHITHGDLPTITGVTGVNSRFYPVGLI